MISTSSGPLGGYGECSLKMLWHIYCIKNKLRVYKNCYILEHDFSSFQNHPPADKIGQIFRNYINGKRNIFK